MPNDALFKEIVSIELTTEQFTRSSRRLVDDYNKVVEEIKQASERIKTSLVDSAGNPLYLPGLDPKTIKEKAKKAAEEAAREYIDAFNNAASKTPTTFILGGRQSSFNQMNPLSSATAAKYEGSFSRLPPGYLEQSVVLANKNAAVERERTQEAERLNRAKQKLIALEREDLVWVEKQRESEAAKTKQLIEQSRLKVSQALSVGAGAMGMMGQWQGAAGMYALGRAANAAGVGDAALFGSVAGGATLAAGAIIGLGAAVYKFQQYGDEFNRSLAQMNTLLDGTPAQVDKLGRAAIRLSIIFNRSFVDTVQGMKTALSAGIMGDDLEAFMSQAGKLANSIGGDFNKATDLLTSFKDAYGLTITELTSASDQLFNVIDVGKVTGEAIQKNFGRVIPIAAQAGVALKELNTAFAAITRGGITAPQAVTSLVNIITDLQHPTEKSRLAFEKLGIAYGATALKGRSFISVLEEIKNKVKSSPDLLGEMFPDHYAQRGVAALFERPELIKQAADGMEKVGSSTKAADVATNTFGDNFDRTWKRNISGPLTEGSNALANFLNYVIYSDQVNISSKERLTEATNKATQAQKDFNKVYMEGIKNQYSGYSGEGIKTRAQEILDRNRDRIKDRFLKERLTPEQSSRLGTIAEERASIKESIASFEAFAKERAKAEVAAMDPEILAKGMLKEDKKAQDKFNDIISRINAARNAIGTFQYEVDNAVSEQQQYDSGEKLELEKAKIKEAEAELDAFKIAKLREYREKALKIVEESVDKQSKATIAEHQKEIDALKKIDEERAKEAEGIRAAAEGQKTKHEQGKIDAAKRAYEHDIANYKDYQIKIEQMVASSEEKKQKIREDYHDKQMKLQDDYFKKFQDIQDKINGKAIERAAGRGPRKAVEVISGQYQMTEAQAQRAAARGDKVELDRLTASMEKLAQAFDENYTKQGFRYSTDIYSYDRNKSFSEVNQEKTRGLYNTSYGIDSANMRDKGAAAIKAVDQTTFRNIMAEELKRANDGKANITNSGNTFAPVVNVSVVQNVAAGGASGSDELKKSMNEFMSDLERRNKAGIDTKKRDNNTRDDSGFYKEGAATNDSGFYRDPPPGNYV